MNSAVGISKTEPVGLSRGVTVGNRFAIFAGEQYRSVVGFLTSALLSSAPIQHVAG